MILHLRHAAEQGHSKEYLRTVDTDVVILTIYHFQNLKPSELWVGLGSGKAFGQVPIHYVCHQPGPLCCQALPFFHAYTGCDVVAKSDPTSLGGRRLQSVAFIALISRNLGGGRGPENGCRTIGDG